MLGCLGAILGHVGLSWGHVGTILGCIEAILGLSWEHLWPYWGHLGPSWGHVGHSGAILGHLGVNLAILRCHLGGLEGCPTRFGGSWGSTWPSWGAILADLKDLPRALGVPGQFFRDVTCGLGGPVGLKIKAIRAPRGFGDGFWGLGGKGETRQENRRLRIYGYVNKYTRRM
jgi:hypothetical protein